MNTKLNIRDIMLTAPVIPVLVVEDPAQAVPLAQALTNGGLRVLEFTLRTASALESISAVAQEVPDAIVGVGTVNDPEDMQRASDAGACFAVSPGFTPGLAAAALDAGLPYLPGVASASEVLAARASQLTALKFFPAVQAGGPAMLKALQGPFADTVFCPTGGINADLSLIHI